jgi:hypothetical protein
MVKIRKFKLKQIKKLVTTLHYETGTLEQTEMCRATKWALRFKIERETISELAGLIVELRSLYSPWGTADPVQGPYVHRRGKQIRKYKQSITVLCVRYRLLHVFTSELTFLMMCCKQRTTGGADGRQLQHRTVTTPDGLVLT